VNNGAFVSDPATQDFVDLSIEENGYLAGGVGDVFNISGRLVNRSRQATLWDTAAAKVGIVGAGLHEIVWSGQNRGAGRGIEAGNFSIGTLAISSAASISLLDGDTTPGGAIYTYVLQLDGGLAQIPRIAGNGLDIFYDPAAPENSYLVNGSPNGTYALQNGGAILPVPEPATGTLAFAGVLCIAGRFRRTKRRS
jgi:hypothetical protein